jgi:hypothetical protein
VRKKRLSAEAAAIANKTFAEPLLAADRLAEPPRTLGGAAWDVSRLDWSRKLHQQID